MPSAGLRHRLTRRGLLKLGLGVGGVTVALAGVGAYLTWPRAIAPGRRALAVDEAAFIQALGEGYLPAGNGVLEAHDFDVVGGVDAYVAVLPPTERRLLRALLSAADQLPRLTGSSPSSFTSMSVAERGAFLASLEQSAVQTKRELALLFRMLVGIAVFDDRRAFDTLGFDWGCPVIPS